MRAKEKKERARLIFEISTLLTRYPEVHPRSNSALIERLESLPAMDLKNIYMNAMNDVQEIRGNNRSRMTDRRSRYYATYDFDYDLYYYQKHPCP